MSQLIQYVIIRGDLLRVLNWPIGALIAQCCHATTAVSHLNKDDSDTQEYFKEIENMHKVVLEVSDEAALQLLNDNLKENDIKFLMWMEQPENIPTCIAIKPYRKEVIQKYVKKYKLFK